MTDTLSELTQQLISAARSAGAEAADAIAIDGTSLAIDVLGGKLEQAERSEGTEIGLRVLIGRRQACVSASDTNAATIATMAERAVAMAREAPEDKWSGLADPGQIGGHVDPASLDMVDPAAPPSPEALEDMARAAETAALAVKGVTQVEQSGASWSTTQAVMSRRVRWAGTFRTHSTRHK